MMKLFAVVLIVFSQFPFEDAFKIKPRIVNGHTSPERLFPYYVYLKIDMEEANTFGDCGGTLLNEQFILTAGHCTYEATAIEVHLGTADLYSPHDVVRVEKHNFFQYPHHVVEEIVNDISRLNIVKSDFKRSFCSFMNIHLMIFDVLFFRFDTATKQSSIHTAHSTCSTTDNM